MACTLINIIFYKSNTFVHQTGMTKVRKSYLSVVSDEEMAFCTPYQTLMKEDSPQREHSLRDLLNGLRCCAGVRGE